LKIRQRISGRLADALGELYLLATVLKRWRDDGYPADDKAVVDLCLANGLARFNDALRGAIDNFPVRAVRPVLRALVFPLGRHLGPASDRLAHAAVRGVLTPGAYRDRLTRAVFISMEPQDPTGCLEVAMAKAVQFEEAERKLDRAVRSGQVRRAHGHDWIAAAQAAGILTDTEAAGLRDLERLTDRVVAVDDFDPSEVGRRGHAVPPDPSRNAAAA
jgi:acyl-CoA dehydrogenase